MQSHYPFDRWLGVVRLFEWTKGATGGAHCASAPTKNTEEQRGTDLQLECLELFPDREGAHHDSPKTVPAVTAVMVIVLTWGEETVTFVAMGVDAVMVLAKPAQMVRAVVCSWVLGREESVFFQENQNK